MDDKIGVNVLGLVVESMIDQHGVMALETIFSVIKQSVKSKFPEESDHSIDQLLLDFMD